MRYMGDVTPAPPIFPIPNIPPIPFVIPGVTPGPSPAPSPVPAAPAAGAPLDPQTKAVLLALAPQMPDSNAADLQDILDATPYGKNQRWMRYGIGAAAGLVVGVVIAKAVRGAIGV
jgi:hypothetical protein